MAYKTGSITSFILPANILMCSASAASVYFFCNQDYLAGWISSLVTLVILLGIPDYTKRILDNTISLIRSYNESEKSSLQIPGFADELQSINHELQNLKSSVIKTRDTNALSAIATRPMTLTRLTKSLSKRSISRMATADSTWEPTPPRNADLRPIPTT